VGDWSHRNTTDDSATEETSQRNRRLGLVLFCVYLGLYAGFVLLSAFRPDVCDAPALGGVNVAVMYGFALIIAAFVLALVYGVLCGLTGQKISPSQTKAEKTP